MVMLIRLVTILLPVENHGVTELQDSLVELLKAEQRIHAFSDSINQLKTKWQDGQLDDSVDIVQVSHCIIFPRRACDIYKYVIKQKLGF